MKHLTRWLPIVLVLGACAHAGQDNSGPGASPGDDASSTAGGDGGGTPAVAAGTFTQSCSGPVVGSPMLRLLTNAEFDNTINDIFPTVAGQWTDTLPSDVVSAYGFDNDGSATVGNQLASALLDTALSIATAVTGTNALTNLLPCAATTADHTCAETFLMQYGKRLFRRPVTSAEHDRYLAFFDASKAKSDFPTALKWMTVGLIQSPNAIYRSEIGASGSGGGRSLSPYEVATELSYTFGGSTPSADLLAKADSGNLGDLASLAKALLATDKGQQAVQHFFEGYLSYTRVTSIQKPNISGFAAAAADMANETRDFITNVIVQNGGGLKELLTSNTTYLTQNLAQYYGYPAPATNRGPITRPASKGLGILAQGAFLATHANADASSPTQRGLFPFQKLFCHPKPMPPPNVPSVPAANPNMPMTTRQRYEDQHASQQPCAGCHKLWDPIGFGFEHYDEGGRYRTTDNGLPVNSASDVPNLDYTPLFMFNDEEGLVTGMTQQSEIYDCFAEYLATYAFGSGESCLGTSHVADLQSGKIGILEAFADLVSEPHFSSRSAQ